MMRPRQVWNTFMHYRTLLMAGRANVNDVSHYRPGRYRHAGEFALYGSIQFDRQFRDGAHQTTANAARHSVELCNDSTIAKETVIMARPRRHSRQN
jgi:hypothetical protein